MIRQAVGGDADAIRRCAAEAYGRYVPRIGRKPAPMMANFVEQIAARQVHVAVDGNDDVLGFIAFYPKDDHVFLEGVAVFPHAAGRGIGKALIAYCEAAASAQGIGAVHLYTNEKMTENLLIYPRLGYTEVDRRTEDGFNRVYFVKRLA